MQRLLAHAGELRLALLAEDVVLLAGVLAQVVELLGLVAVVVDVLLVALYPGGAREVGSAVEVQRTPLGQEQREQVRLVSGNEAWLNSLAGFNAPYKMLVAPA